MNPSLAPTRKPSIADLHAFVCVGELKSFAAAAQVLHLSQPALSRRIARLEALVGARLIDRTTRWVALTPLGERFRARIRGVIDDLDGAIVGLHDLARLEAGEVTVGCVFSAVQHFLPPVIRAFREQHPNVDVRIIEEGADAVQASVKSGEADFAVSYVGLQDPELEFIGLLREPFVLACPADHPLARRRSVRWTVLAEHPYALVAPASRNRLLIDQALAEIGPLPRPVCEVRHVATLIGLVQAGLAVAVVPQLALPPDAQAVVGVHLEAPRLTRTLGLLRRRGRSLSPAAAAFAALLSAAGRARGRTAARAKRGAGKRP